MVQHPKEQFHPLNTVRIAEMSLENSVVIRSPLGGIEAAIKRAGISDDAAIVYPSRDAEALEELAPDDYPREVILLDGTWHHAKTLLRDVPAFDKYRRVRFTPPAPSEYRIRQEPKADYLSTIESIAHVLSVLEGNTPGIEGLRETFRRMIDRNVDARKPADAGRDTRYRRRSVERAHRFPGELLCDAENAVVLYAEGTRPFSRRRDDDGSRKEPLVIYAVRPETSESLRLLLRTEAEAPERLMGHLGLTAEEVAQEGLSHREAAEALRLFIKGSDTLFAWNASSGAIIKEVGFKGPEALQLKGAYCDWSLYLEQREKLGAVVSQSARWGGMGDIIERRGIEPVAVEGPGRGPLRVAQTIAVLGWMREQTAEYCDPELS